MLSDQLNAGALPLREAPQFALYIHIPFCISKCPYCDFNSYGIKQDYKPQTPLALEHDYCTAVQAELDHYCQLPPWKSRTLRSVFFGGGTPSLFQTDSLSNILKQVRNCWNLSSDCEITLEANPSTIKEDLGLEKLRALREAGFNRISFGIQSLRAEKLQRLGRWHTVEDGMHSLEAARNAGFDNINLDLMYGLPGETRAQWESELSEAVSLQPNHLSCYALTIEPGTEFHRMQRRGISVQGEEEVLAEMYVSTQQIVASKHFIQYEVSNFSKPDAACRHNQHYWKLDSYLGIGAGAHSFTRRDATAASSQSQRWINAPKPEHYITQVSAGQGTAGRLEKLNLEQEVLEVLYCFVRTEAGLKLSSFEEFFGSRYRAQLADSIQRLQSEGLITYDKEHLRLSTRGYLFSDYVLNELSAACVQGSA